MDQEERKTTPAASRSQNTVYVLPHDLARIRQFLAPALERAQRSRREASDGEAGAAPPPDGPAVIVFTADAEGAVAAASTAQRLLGEGEEALVPLTAAGRAARLLRAGVPLGVAGTPDVLAELVRGAALKLESVQTVILAWADDILASGAGASLELLLGELPRETAHVVVAGDLTEELEALIERHLRRPRRMTDAPEALEEPLRAPVHYLTVAPASRLSALRRLLDELDPERAVIVAPSEEGAADVRLALALLGYRGEEAAVQLTAGDVPDATSLVVLYELPTDPAQLARVHEASPEQVVALVAPRELSALRRLSGNNVAAYTLADARRAARHREEALRAELRALLEGGAPTRELFTLEPLLSEFDGVELAAALLRLLEDERRARATTSSATRAAAGTAATAAGSEWTRVFVNVGGRDGASVGDVLGAVAGESGVSRDRIGRIELRDTHSLVDVATDVVDQVVSAVTGATLRGRRLVAREDRERPAGAGGAGRERAARADRGDRPPRGDRPGGTRGERPGRSDRPTRGDRPLRGERPVRGERATRGERPARGERPRRDDDRGARGPRRGGGARDERNASYGRTLRDEEREWAGRGERVRHARRPRPGEARHAAEDRPPRRRRPERE